MNICLDNNNKSSAKHRCVSLIFEHLGWKLKAFTFLVTSSINLDSMSLQSQKDIGMSGPLDLIPPLPSKYPTRVPFKVIENIGEVVHS